MKKRFIIIIGLIIFSLLGYLYINSLDKTAFYNDETEMSIEELHWQRVFEKAFEPVDCPEPRNISLLPDGYYKGPIIDSHIHLQSLPDGKPGQSDESYSGENLGIKKSMEEWICMLNVEGTQQAWGFFPVWEPIVPESVEIVKLTMEKYPGHFIPFIMPPDADEPTVAAEELEEMLNIEPGLFKGYGEIGLYGNSNSPPLSPDSEELKEIYEVVRKHDLVVYFHLGEGQNEAFERTLEANPDITFVFHGDQLIDCAQCDGTHKLVSKILENHPNAYYGVDEIYGGAWLLKPGADKNDFINHFNEYNSLLEKDIEKFKEFIESHPDQVLWDTDRGVSATWDKDPDVALVLNDYARAFIGKLDPAVQEKFAYRNAERIFSK